MIALSVFDKKKNHMPMPIETKETKIRLKK